MNDHTVVVTRTFNAARTTVFKMWTDPSHLVHWVIPRGFAAPIIEQMDARTGGSLRMRMNFSDGSVYLSKWSFVEVTEPERIIYDEVCDVNGETFHRARQTVEFTERDGRTTLSIRGEIKLVPGRDPKLTLEVMRAGWSDGWNENFDKLAALINAR